MLLAQHLQSVNWQSPPDQLRLTQYRRQIGLSKYLILTQIHTQRYRLWKCCNVMVTRPTNHMISTRDHLHDLLLWSRHVSYLDIKSTSSHHQYQHPHHHSYVMTTSGLLICHVCAMSTSWSPHHCSTRLPPIVDLGQVLGGLPGRLLLDSNGGGVREGFPQSLLMKATERLLLDQRLSKF